VTADLRREWKLLDRSIHALTAVHILGVCLEAELLLQGHITRCPTRLFSVSSVLMVMNT